MQDFRVALVKNPSLKVFVAAGYYDLATPYFSQEYSLTHLLFPHELQRNITFKGYEAGHMMYLDESSRAALFKDLVEFVTAVDVQK
jgi:carboxypeptidase C (cathepsin A)